jgi:hypothetical protein
VLSRYDGEVEPDRFAGQITVSNLLQALAPHRPEHWFARMRAQSNLPDDHHVMRYVPWGRLLRDGDDNVLGFLPQAFRRRETEDAPFVNWLEYFEGDRAGQITASARVFRQTITVGSKSAFGIGNVARIKEVCRNNRATVRILYEPTDDNPAHAGIRRLPRDDVTLLEALAADAFAELVHNAAIS